MGQSEKAARYFENCIRLDPDAPAPHFGFMMALKKHVTNTSVTVKYFKTLAKSSPHNFEVLTQLAILRYSHFYFAKAIRLLRKALSLNSSYKPALLAMGQILKARGHLASAKRYYMKVLSINPRELCALKGMAEACYDSNEIHDAFEYFWSVSLVNKDLRANESEFEIDAKLIVLL